MNHFEFYGIPLALTVDEAALRRAYLLNSKRYHPDFHTLSDDAEQSRALEWSTRNNEAYKTLSDPEQRIRYVLELKGLMEQGENAPLPQDFLMEMMDINEALMELEFDFDQQRFTTTANLVKNLQNALDTQIQPILSSWSDPGGSADDLVLVREYFFKKRYLLRIKENLSKFAPA